MIRAAIIGALRAIARDSATIYAAALIGAASAGAAIASAHIAIERWLAL